MPDEISAATHHIGQAMFLSAAMNAAPFQENSKAFGAVIFGSSVVAGAHAILSLIALDQPEAKRRDLLVLIHNDLMLAMRGVLMAHAPSGFSMAIRDGTPLPVPPEPPVPPVPPEKPPRFQV